MVFLDKLVSLLNGYLWDYLLIIMLIGLGIFFSFKTGFVQIRCLGEMFHVLGEGLSHSSDKTRTGISSFQAFCIGVASRVGVGNLAGVAMAIFYGGPGAVFWMWLIALMGGASSFVENTLAQIYKVKDGENFKGGPAYYMELALNKRWMGVIFAVLISLCFGWAFNALQANTITAAFDQAFGLNPVIVGTLLTIATLLIIFGGVHRIAKISSVVVPIMALGYIGLTLFIIGKNITAIPGIFALIFTSAFGPEQFVGGVFGAAIMQGIKRGLFSNEAGMGSAPNAAATATISHPVKQGLIQTLGVFTDTLLICSCTAFIVLISSESLTMGQGVQITQYAISTQVGPWGNIFVAICIFLFAFTSIIGNYAYAEGNIKFIKDNKAFLMGYRLCVGGMILFGSLAKIQLVWDIADLFMGLMAVTNLIALFFLYKIPVCALDDYLKQKKLGIDPVFYADSISLPHPETVTCWKKKNNETIF
ncbi:MAG: alanine/glycine:cation symporter family protein [Anaerovorax sp.]